MTILTEKILAILMVFALFVFACSPSPPENVVTHSKITWDEITLRKSLETASPNILKEHRPMAKYKEIALEIQPREEGFSIKLSLYYQTFFRPKTRAVDLVFEMSTEGVLANCFLQDPSPSAAKVPCQRMEDVILQNLSP